jgi:hypothetical protein
MRIVKSLKRSILPLICLLALLFIYGCQCEGELGTKVNNASVSGTGSSVVDKK